MEFESETFWVSVTLEYVRLMSCQSRVVPINLN